jgi:hypothetical protein
MARVGWTAVSEYASEAAAAGGSGDAPASAGEEAV